VNKRTKGYSSQTSHNSSTLGAGSYNDGSQATPRHSLDDPSGVAVHRPAEDPVPYEKSNQVKMEHDLLIRWGT